jgi:hypothetical protein
VKAVAVAVVETTKQTNVQKPKAVQTNAINIVATNAIQK